MANPSKTSPLRVVLYGRVSSAEQKRKHTIESQPPELERLLRGLDGPVEVVPAPDGSRYWLDEGRSGRSLHRRVLGTLLGQLDAGEVQADVILVRHQDRLFRRDPKSPKSLKDCHRIELALLEHGVRVLTSEGWSDPNDPLPYAVRTGMASHENKLKSDRVNEARTNRLSSGKPIWRLPYGYYRKPHDPLHPGRGGSVAVDPIRSAHLARLVAWTIEGGVAHATRKATEAGIPLPSDPVQGPCRPWDQAHLWRIMAKADVYLGTLRYTYRGVSGEVSVPPLLDHGTYLHLRQAMQSRARPRGKRVHAFSGLLRCSGCGHTMQIHTRGSRAYLQCHFCAGGPGRYDGELETWLWTTARAWVLAVADADAVASRGNGLEAALQEARAALKEVQRREEALVDLHLDGSVSKTVYDRKRAPLASEARKLGATIESIRKRIDERDAKASHEASAIDRAFATARRMQGEVDPQEQNRMLRDLLGTDRVVFETGDPMRVTYPKRGTLDAMTMSQGEPVRLRLVVGPDGPVEMCPGGYPSDSKSDG